MKKRAILIVDDDSRTVVHIKDRLTERNILSYIALDMDEALNILADDSLSISTVLIDIFLPRMSKRIYRKSDVDYRRGLDLARKIRQLYPRMRVVGMSMSVSSEVKEWFHRNGGYYIDKSLFFNRCCDDALRLIEQINNGRSKKYNPKSFIVHGHDDLAVKQVSDFITLELKWPAPVILRELPNQGRTIIEKFEDAAQMIDVVFVLITPDDFQPLSNGYRARQNVIFELGYFYAKLQRHSGRVIVLNKGNTEIPSDLYGIAYIDITEGISNARRELFAEFSVQD